MDQKDSKTEKSGQKGGFWAIFKVIWPLRAHEWSKMKKFLCLDPAKAMVGPLS